MGRQGTNDGKGYFLPDSSILRRVQHERLVGLFYGQRALCIGALAPLNYVGTSEHTHERTMPWKRLARTGKAFETVFFGSRAQADDVIARVHNLHGRVNGVLPEDAGAFPAGTPYSALDSDLMLWTVAVMADSAQRFYELFVRRLSLDEREGLWQDYVRFGELFGMSRDTAPPTHAAFRTYLEAQLASGRMFLTPEARQVGYQTAFKIPMPRSYQLAKRVHDLIILGSLPARVRDHYELPYTRAHAFLFALTVFVVRAARRTCPSRLRRGWNTHFFELIARTERWRIEHGKATPQLWEREPATEMPALRT
ncbi:MAG TPA: oxygenase MpaB family protein [Solirubrobacteraceae bacterium]|nr:oxygenase MpaB family protein [Solirubrobacteraceae bacterium]